MLAAMGACLVLAGAAGAGACLCLERKKRIAQLYLFTQVFGLMAGEIAYSRISLPEVFLEAGRRLEGDQGLGEVLRRLGKRLCDGTGQDIRTVWEQELGEYLRRTHLKPEERERILSFPSAVQYLDGARQQEAVAAFSRVFSEKAQQAVQAQKEENKITMALSVACGALAAILLA